MSFFPKLFFEASANEGGGSTTTDTPTTDTPAIPEIIQKELEELRAFKLSIAEKQEKTPEQLNKEAELDKADLIRFSTENDLMKVDDFTKYETSKQRQDRELVFENFAKDWKEENKDATDDETQEAFNEQYHLNSENEKLKIRGEKMVAKEAKDLRTPLETSYNTAKERFSQDKTLRQDYPKFQKYLTATIESSIPEKVKVGEKKIDEENVAIEVGLTKDEKKEIFDAVQKELSNPQTFLTWKKQTKDGKNEMIEKMISKETKYLINEKKQQVAFEKTADEFYKKGESVGAKKGSKVGATEPFAIVRKMGAREEKQNTNAQENVAKADMELRTKIHHG